MGTITKGQVLLEDGRFNFNLCKFRKVRVDPNWLAIGEKKERNVADESRRRSNLHTDNMKFANFFDEFFLGYEHEPVVKLFKWQDGALRFMIQNEF